MEVAHFEAALNGDVNKFPFCDIEREDLSEIFNKVSPSGNSLLHVASSSGHEQMTQLIARNFPYLVTKKNSEGNTALHLAVRAQKLNTVRALVELSKHIPNSSTSTETLLTTKNDDGNTALHEALFAIHSSKKNVITLVDVACYLVLMDPKVSCHQNNAGKSPLCMAVESGNKVILEYILGFLPKLGNDFAQIVEGKSPVHAAIEHEKLDLLRIINEEKEELLLLRDEEGNTPLHFAAYKGYKKGVRYLLEIKSNWAFERNNKGFYPLHLACENGHVKVTKELFRKWPDPAELLCNKGQSILHVAAKSGKENVVRYLLKEKSCNDKLVNKMDKNGNTPFHLAALHGHSMVVVALMLDKRSKVEVVNYQGLTAYDMFKSNVFAKVQDQQIDVNDRNLKADDGDKENSVEVCLKSSEKSKQFQMGVSFLLALMLKVLGPHQYYDTDDEYAPDRVPLLKNAVHPPTYVVGDPVCGSRTDAWTIRVNDKGHSATSAHTCTGDGNAMVACAGLLLEACRRKLSMQPVHFKAALNGNVSKFPFCDIEREDLSEIFNKVSPSGNSLLHVASSSGHEEMTELIARNFPFLITKQNYEGNTALHLAVRAHKLNTVKKLVILSKQNPNTSTDTFLTMKNDDGNTALHEALFALHASKKNVDILVDVACYLVLNDPNVSCHQNKAGKSPLYMAVESDNEDILKYILDFLPDQGDGLLQRLQGKSPVHVAIEQGKLGMLRIIKEQKEELLLLRDEEGNTLLHFAAYIGYSEGVRYLLEINSNWAFERNSKGYYPLHLACKNGYIKVTKVLFREWPDPTELLCNKGQSILHVAAKSGKENVVRYLLKEKCTDKLVNKMDKKDNTPFHLAALHGHSMVVVALMHDKRSNVDALNYQGLTAYDIFKSNVFSKDQQIVVDDRNLKASGVKENSVEVELKNSEKPKQFQMMMIYSMLYMYLEFFPSWRITRHRHMSTKISRLNRKLPTAKQDVNNTINNLFVVAALIVGAAFAGVLQIPYDGGHATDNPNRGVSFLLALMLKALGPHQYYDSDDEYAPDRVPLLKNAVHPPTYVVGDPVCGSRTDAWTIRVNDKVEILNLSIGLTASQFVSCP
ncbi:hypothetical protein LWI29_029408 [Acer saccharum]|uniref:PGG domain-containing protein n=1 Tax=Acer saccharum TaxID=4024 RepID=A0AA39SJ63_ACESA|nr:hypothetical protein LWI29_029408 [Acer saccharum]